MEDINTNYIHHITDDQYKEAVEYLLCGTIPSHKRSAGARTRFRRRWKNAELKYVEEDGAPSLYIEHREVIPSSKIDRILSQLYDDPATGGNLGRDKFYDKVVQRYIGISRADVEKFVQNDEVHQIHRPIANRFKVVRPLHIPEGPGIRWQMDLIDLGAEKQHDNLGYRYVLLVIDIFSKMLWTRKLKSKEGDKVAGAFEDILQQGEPAPHVLQSDNGSEFRNRWFTELLDEDHYNVKQVHGLPYKPQSQGCVERVGKTIKRMLYSHMTRYNTNIWADVLQVTVKNYNTMTHSSTGYTPQFLHGNTDASIVQKVRERIQKRNCKWLESNKSKYFKEVQVGDSVRVCNLVFKENRKKKKSHMVTKSYKPNWSREIYQVVSISKSDDNNDNDVRQPLYTLCSQDTIHLPIQSQNRAQVFRDNIQLLPGPNPRITTAPRPTYHDFFYREDQRQMAKNARGTTRNYLPVERLVITDEARQRRRPNTRLGNDYDW